MITFTIPLPPSFNNAQRNARTHIRYMTAEAAHFKHMAFMKARSVRVGGEFPLGPEERKRARYALTLVLHFPSVRRFDLDNRVKLAQDAIADGLDFDDSQIDDLRVIRGEVDRRNPRCEVTLSILRNGGTE